MSLRLKKNLPFCRDCQSDQYITDDTKTGAVLCTNCGCIIENTLIDEKTEWRTFDDSANDPSRVGGPNNPLLGTEPLDTMIANIGNLHSYTLNRTQMKSTMRGPERQLINGFNLISAYCDRSNISKTISDRAKLIFKRVDEKKILKGKNLEGVVAACIYIACRQEQSPRTFKEVSVLTAVPKKEIGRSFKLIFPHIEKLQCVTTDDIVARFCSDLNLGIDVQKIAVQISKNVIEKGCMAGKSPDSVAAAVIYMITYIFPNLKGVQKDIQYVTNVTDVTIKNTYKELMQYKEDILPKEILSKARLPN
ncbi:Transcription initiation factor TFIIB [Trachipleistophora hominis]|uniref:Transcription initiation factor IIB n=1 Tax=Trachipleistophora hominis TaxID=72359 RepID=L7JT83_TRAHO|nr:Transcription initiation factor TFIIB [Trachipleistophora hominis]